MYGTYEESLTVSSCIPGSSPEGKFVEEFHHFLSSQEGVPLFNVTMICVFFCFSPFSLQSLNGLISIMLHTNEVHTYVNGAV